MKKTEKLIIKYEDEMTKCFILTAINKIHSGINYLELSFVNDAINKYTKIKNPEIQQRCLEYKRNIEKRIKERKIKMWKVMILIIFCKISFWQELKMI